MEELKEKIELDKEMLSVYPQNNVKNIEKYKKKLIELKEEYTKYDKEILEEIENRFNLILNVKTNPEIEKIKTQKEDIEQNLYLINDAMSSYEKMGLDKSMLKLRRFYKENLDVINTEIAKILNKFAKVGVNIDLNDFGYNEYVKSYMQIFINEKNILNSAGLNEKFEEIYWKCPDLLIYIRLNFMQKYLKNEKEINKYFENKKQEYLNSINKNKEELLNEYTFLNKMYMELVNEDKKIILNKFYNDELKIQNYSNENVKNNELKVIPKELLDINDNELRKVIDENLLKLEHSLYEYKEYLKFKFIIDDIKTIIENTEKDDIKVKMNEIKAGESKINKTLKTINKKGIFKLSNQKLEELQEQYNALILKLADSYKELNKSLLNEKIRKNINKNTNIYEVLKVASSFYEYVDDCRFNKDKEADVTKEELENCWLELDEFVKWPYFTILNNMTIYEEKSIPRVIHDIYKLLDMEIKEEDLEEDNLDNLISSIEIVKQNYYIEKANINKEEIDYLGKFKKILNEK